MSTTSFQINKTAFNQTQIVEVPETDTLQENQALINVETFALTANNITYAVVGEMVGYWKFFPVDETWGIIPAWGFATVEKSKHPDLKEGTKIYGYFPMNKKVVFEAGNFKVNGFNDVIAHRTQLPPIYNFYYDVAKDPSFQIGNDNITMIFRPLFTTSFLIDFFLNEEQFFESENIILTSASSKTGFALGYLLHARKKAENLNINIIGLTSEKNKEFVESLGFYDEVNVYDNLSAIQNKPTTIVDFSGHQELLISLQEKLGENHKNTTKVGVSHWDRAGGKQAQGEFFFAPDWMKKMSAKWGFEEFNKRLGKSWMGFLSSIENTMNYTELNGFEELKTAYLEVLSGKTSPKTGYIVKL